MDCLWMTERGWFTRNNVSLSRAWNWFIESFSLFSAVIIRLYSVQSRTTALSSSDQFTACNHFPSIPLNHCLVNTEVDIANCGQFRFLSSAKETMFVFHESLERSLYPTNMITDIYLWLVSLIVSQAIWKSRASISQGNGKNLEFSEVEKVGNSGKGIKLETFTENVRNVSIYCTTSVDSQYVIDIWG